MGFIRYNQEIETGPIKENEKRMVFFMFALCGGERFNGVMQENLLKFILCVLGLNYEEYFLMSKKRK